MMLEDSRFVFILIVLNKVFYRAKRKNLKNIDTKIYVDKERFEKDIQVKTTLLNFRFH